MNQPWSRKSTTINQEHADYVRIVETTILLSLDVKRPSNRTNGNTHAPLLLRKRAPTGMSASNLPIFPKVLSQTLHGIGHTIQ